MGNTMTANIKCTENNIGKHAASFFDLWLKKKKGVDGIVRHRFVPCLGGAVCAEGCTHFELFGAQSVIREHIFF